MAVSREVAVYGKQVIEKLLYFAIYIDFIVKAWMGPDSEKE